MLGRAGDISISSPLLSYAGRCNAQENPVHDRLMSLSWGVYVYSSKLRHTIWILVYAREGGRKLYASFLAMGTAITRVG